MTLSSDIKTLTSYERTCEFQRAMNDLIVEAILGLNGNPRQRFKALVKESFEQPVKFLIEIISSRPQLKDAYTDVLVYKTPVEVAAQDAGVQIADLVWLIGQYPLEIADREDFPVSKVLRSRRSIVSCKRE